MALIDKASLLMVPSTYEAGTLYNVLPSGNRAPDSTDQNSGYDQTRADFDFDRGSNAAATRVNASGLIEKYRENLLVQSNNFGTTWVNNGTTETSGQSGYDGSSDAWLLEKSIAGGSIRQAITYNGVGVFSIYAKASSLNHMLLYINYGSGTDSQAYFNLLNGSVGTTIAEIDAKIADAGNGWYRCSIAFNTPSATATILVFPSDADGSTSGTSGSIYIQSAQLESGLVASSYLESTSVTGKAGVLVDLPRINYDANGENGALLLEPSRQNLITQSEYFGAWTLNGGGTGSNPVLDFGHTSPEGVDNAYKVTFDTGAGTTTSDESIMYISKSGLTIGNEYTASVYLKGAVGGEEVIVRDTTGGYVKWTLTNEWKRYEMTQAAAGSSYATSFGVRQGLGGIGTINSDAVVYMYGFQSEAGNYVSSYIPTMGTSETRAADLMYTGPTDLGGGSVGTLMVEIERIAIDTANTGAGVQLLTSSDNEEIRLHFDAPLSQVRWRDANNGYAQIGAVLSVTAGEFFKMCLVSDGTTAKAFGNGAQLGGDYSIVTAFDFDKLSLPQKAYKVKQIYFSNQALTDAECVTLTTL